MLTNIYRHLFDVYRLFGGTKSLFEWDLAFFVASSWMAWCLCGAWLEKDQVFIHLLFKISLMLTNLYRHLFDVYRLFGGTEISILFEWDLAFFVASSWMIVTRSLSFADVFIFIFLLWVFIVMLVSRLAIIACRIVCLLVI